MVYLLKKILTSVLFNLFMIEIFFAQSVSIINIDPSGFPNVRAKVVFFGKDGKLISNVNPKDFLITEEGNSRATTNIFCPKISTPKSISSVLTIDISGSMESFGPRIELAKVAAKAWVDGLDLGNSECAITSFNEKSYINQDFSIKRSDLNQAIYNLKPSGGTSYNDGFLMEPGGSLSISKFGKNKRIIVFLTDGQGSGNQDEIIQTCLEQKVIVYCVTLGMQAPDILKNIAIKSGGEYFENVTTKEQAENIYRKILSIAEEVEPCEISWISQPGCSEIHQVEFNFMDRKYLYDYKVPASAIASLEILPSRLEFGSIKINSSKEITATLTAKNYPITITGIKPIQNLSQFSLKNTSLLPLTLQPNQSQDITISYSPKDSGFAFASFKIETNICPDGKIFCSGGFKSIKPSSPTLHLINPNGGEVFAAGSNVSANWEGLSPEDSVRIEISSDGGSSWKIIKNNAPGMKLDFIIPSTESKKCLARVTQLKTNEQPDKSGKVTKSNRYSVPSLSFNSRENFGAVREGVSSLQISPDGKFILTACWDKDENNRSPEFYGKTRLFDANTGTGIKSFLGGYHAIFSPDGSKILSYEDCTFFCWETKSGKLLWQNEINKSLNGFKDAKFFADGSRIVCIGGWGDSVYMINPKNGKIITPVPGTLMNNELKFLAFSPDGLRIAFIDTKKTLFIIDLLNKNKNLSILDRSDQIEKAIFSPDGLNLLTVSYKGIAKLWNTLSGKEIMVLEKSGVMNGDFSPDGSLIALLNRNGMAIYDLVKGVQINKFTRTDTRSISPTGILFSPDGAYITLIAVYSLQVLDSRDGNVIASCPRSNATPIFSPDSYKLFSSESAGKINVYELIGSSIQQDVSDSLWSIVKPRIESKDIDFGKKLIFSITDTVIQGFITNANKIKTGVNSIKIAGKDVSDFSVVSGTAPFEIDGNSTKEIEIRFSPSTIGKKNAIIELLLSDGTAINQNLTGECVKPMIEVIPKRINFENVVINHTSKKSFTSFIKNPGNTSVNIKKIFISEPDFSQFRIIHNIESFTLAPNEERGIEIEFNPKKIGRTSSNMIIEYEGIGSQEMISLYGIGLDSISATNQCISKLIETKYSIGINPIYFLAPGLKAEIDYNNFGAFFTGMILPNAGKYDDPPTATEFDASNYSTNFMVGLTYHFQIGCDFYPFAGIFTGLKTRYWKDHISLKDTKLVRSGNYSDYPIGIVTGAKYFLSNVFYLEAHFSFGSYGYHERLTGEIKKYQLKSVPWISLSYMFK